MQWVLQEFEDTAKLAEALDRVGAPYTWHKVVPFVGDLLPAPEIADPDAVVLFGSYTLWRYAAQHDLKPGVFRVRPFVHERPWQPFMLNGPDARFMLLRDVPNRFQGEDRSWFMRPVDDSKEEPGRVHSEDQIVQLAQKVLALREEELPSGSLRHDTELMFTQPVHIQKEWRIWIVRDRIVTTSLYKEGNRVVYRPEIDDDAMAFAKMLVAENPGYADAYVMDICRTDAGLRLLETNCINAAGFYAADLVRLAAAINDLAGTAA